MSDEYFAVILEFNLLQVKVGFAGEASEHVCLSYEDPLWKSVTSGASFQKDSPSFLELSSHALEKGQRKDFLERIYNDASYKVMMATFKQDQADTRFFDWSVDRYKALSKLLKVLVHSNLLISPSKTKLLVLNHGMPLNQKFVLCEAILEIGAAVSVSFLPFAECAAIAAGMDDATVLSIQWNTCILSVVSDLRPVFFEEYQNFSGETLYYYQVAKDQISDFHRIYTEKFCTSKSMDSMLSGESGLVERVAHVIRQLSIDLRGKVASNVVICGEISDVPGLKGRILTELASRLPGYNISGKECLGAWVGASLYCSTSLLKENYANWTHVELTKSNLSKEIMKEVGVFSTPT